ncbi:hypothetical protein GCU60_14710 [Blastococcus saxobsidens]|uniref:DUF3618 domain-containing protein n=1 Tax=Blastococcus saxobsidens TaxID=138336 RepID=A0A6L9W4L5_9ACTN|nr:hypothetical protein [Blastococcus saxobsidens]NEK86993.1 hypothetical protein [Blastococcus saxobsidens]
MTHSIDTPFPPPAPAGTGAHSPSSTSGQSKADVAKDEARNVGQTAAQAGGQVAATASDQAKQVVGETQRQAKDLLDQGRSQLKDQAISQQQKAATGLTALAQELRSLADGTSEGAPGPARDLLQQASGMVEGFADKLQNREPAQLLDDVRSFARRKPGMFLLGAAVAGVVAGRLTSGVRAAHSDSGQSGTGTYPGTTNYVDPTPTYSDYSSATTGTGTGTGAPLPPPPYGTVPPSGSMVPPTTPAGWDDPARRPGEVS